MPGISIAINFMKPLKANSVSIHPASGIAVVVDMVDDDVVDALGVDRFRGELDGEFSR